VGWLDQDILVFFYYRVAEVGIVWAVIMFCSIVRHQMRRSGWSRRAVRATTAVMWVVALIAAGRLLVPTAIPFWRTVGPVVFNGFLVLFVIALFLNERARVFIADHPARRIALIREVHRIYARLDDGDIQHERAQIDADLTGLDRWVAPDTFEYIQLARSRVVSGLDGGPRAAERERRWSARMNELQDQLVPAWREDRVSAIGQAIRRPIMAASPWIAAAGAALLGRSVLVGPTWVIVPALIVLGYLATWVWDRIIIPGWIAFGAGLGATGIVYTHARWGSSAFTLLLLEVVVVAIVVASWRSLVRSRPRLTVLTGDVGAVGTGDSAGGPGRIV
jgi:hypothetical protein